MKNKFMKQIILAVLMMAFTLAFVACTAKPAEDAAMPADTSSDAAAAEPAMAEERTFTLEELAQYDGQNGNPAYVAIKGIVYDVTDFPKWAGGKHNGNMAGQDLTDVMATAPHGYSKLDILPVVGKLVE